ncbi:MAG: hypothetical protein ABH829_01380 [archaeon]
MKGWKRERIIRVLLNRRSILAEYRVSELTKYRVAKEAETYYGWAHKVLKQLEERKLIKGTEIINARGLFDYWLGVHKKPKYRDYNVRDPAKLLSQACKKKLEYALTTYAAESAAQHYLFLSRYDLYVKDLPGWHDLIMEAGVRGGGNLRVLYDADPHIFRYVDKHANVRPRSVTEEGEWGVLLADLPRVSAPQLILDLLAEGGPCTEAAELLIKREGFEGNVRKV